MPAYSRHRLILQWVVLAALTMPDPTSRPLAQESASFLKGVDISILRQVELNGGAYTEGGVARDPVDIFSDHGINFARLRLWHTPADGHSNLAETRLMASRITSAGLGLLLDIHYSDTWADPAHQSKPAAWEDLSFPVLKDSVYQYTRDVLTALRDQNTLPGIVQIGNEIVCGMLWDDGHVCGADNIPAQWAQLGEILNEGIRGVRDALGPNDTVKIMIHIDRGGDNPGSQWFFDNLLGQGVDFDLIGLSFYPWWHGTLTDLQSNLTDLAQRYEKEIVIVETAYPWTLSWFDSTQNIVGELGQLHSGYPASVDGQRSFLLDLIEIVRGVPNERGVGLFYWAPEWISVPTLGSPVENLTLFDFHGEVLSSIDAFDSVVTYVGPTNNLPSLFTFSQNFPNPFNPVTTIEYSLQEEAFVVLEIHDLIGRRVRTLLRGRQNAGIYHVIWDGTGEDGESMSSGVYISLLNVNSDRVGRKMVLLR